MKIINIEKVLKKYLAAIKGSEYYVARSDEWIYICDGCSILKIKTTKLAELKENPLPDVGICESVKYSNVEKDFVKDTIETETFERYFRDTEEESTNILVDTGFTRKADKNRKLAILRIVLDNKDGDFYLLNEKYFKIAELFPFIRCTDSNIKACICADSWVPENKTIEFLVLPCRIMENFFTPLAGIENYFKEV